MVVVGRGGCVTKGVCGRGCLAEGESVTKGVWQIWCVPEMVCARGGVWQRGCVAERVGLTVAQGMGILGRDMV